MSIASELAVSRARFESERAAGLALRQAKQSLHSKGPLDTLHHRIHASEETFRNDLISYHCTYCHAFVLVLDAPLPTTPHRSTDGAAILITAERHLRMRVDRGEVRAVRRARGVEKQWRWKCRQCGLPVAYQCEEWQGDTAGSAALLYVMDAAVVSWEDVEADGGAAAGQGGGGGAGAGGAAAEGEGARVREGPAGGVQRSAEEEELQREIEALRQRTAMATAQPPTVDHNPASTSHPAG